jgi:hypothetical protein
VCIYPVHSKLAAAETACVWMCMFVRFARRQSETTKWVKYQAELAFATLSRSCQSPMSSAAFSAACVWIASMSSQKASKSRADSSSCRFPVASACLGLRCNARQCVKNSSGESWLQRRRRPHQHHVVVSRGRMELVAQERTSSSLRKVVMTSSNNSS